MTTTAMATSSDVTRIIAIRHGETAWNVALRIQGSLDIELNECGKAQARQVARALVSEPIAAIYTSDLLRAHETAQAISEATGIKPIVAVGLRERLFGLFEGKTAAEIQAAWPDLAAKWRAREPDFCPAGGESLDSFRDRVLGCVSALVARHRGQQIVLVSHGGINDILYRAARAIDLQEPRDWSLGNAEINRLEWTAQQGFSLSSWAEVEHLQGVALDEINNR